MFNLDDYETVEERLVKFWKDNPNGRIETKLLDFNGGRYIVQAFIYRSMDDQHPWSSGLAEETVAGRGVNATSALENCETSAIGRSLASAGYATKGKRPSREEMSKVAAKNKAEEAIQAAKAKMSQTASTYVPVEEADDPWTTWDAPPVATVDSAVALVQEIIGAEATKEVPNCKCGQPMKWGEGKKQNGQPWANYKCSIWNKSTGSGCDAVIWYEVSPTGTWVPQKKWSK